MDKPAIYIVDDEADYLFLIQNVFAHSLPQYAVSVFASGESLLDNLQINPTHPAIILLDLHMPQMSGMQTLRRIKQGLIWRTIPVVVVTNSTSEPEIQLCYENGANSCLVKPIGLEATQKLLEQVCSYWVTVNGSSTAG